MNNIIDIYNIFKIPLFTKIFINNYLLNNNLIIIICIYIRLLFNINIDKKKLFLFKKKKILFITYSNKEIFLIKNKIIDFLEKIKLNLIYKIKNNLLINYIINLIPKNKIFILYKDNNYFFKKIDFINIYIFYNKFVICNNKINYLVKKNVYKKNIQYKIILNFWKIYILNINIDILNNVIFNIWNNFNNFYYFCLSLKNKNKLYNKNYLINLNINKIHLNNINFINFIKKKISLFNNNNILELFNNLYINKRIYNKKNINKWYNIIINWINIKTNNYYIPKCIKYFSQKFIKSKSKNNNIYPKHTIFKYIDILLNKDFLIIKIIKINFLKYYNININNNLLYINYINNIYKNKKFNKIYKNKIIKNILNKYCFIIICNINKIEIYNILINLFKININFNIIIINNDINKKIIFLKNKYIKIYKYIFNYNQNYLLNLKLNIFFKKNKINKIKKKYIYNNKIINNEINCWFLNSNNIDNNKYIDIMSYKCSEEIYNLLNNNYKYINNKNYIININYKDIIIFVQNLKENNVIQNKLNDLNIPSIYISQKYNIFSQIETKELYNILKSILYINNNIYIKLLFSHTKLIFKNKKNIYKELLNYKYIWNKYGIYYLIKLFIENNNNIFIYNNLILLINILINKEIEIKNKFDLLLWLKYKIKNNNYKDNIFFKNIDNIKIKYIKIINIYDFNNYKNYNIGFFPFISNLIINSLEKKSNIYYIKKINLLYKLFHYIKYTIYISISSINFKKHNYLYKCNFNNTIIGYLLFKNNKIDIIQLTNFFNKLHKFNIINNINIYDSILKKVLFNNKNYLEYKNINIKNKYIINNNFKNNKIINNLSFTKIQNILLKYKKKNILKLPLFNFYNIKTKYNSLFYFPKGINSGLFFHEIFKFINNNNIIDNDFIIDKLNIYNINIKWEKYLLFWLNKYLNLSLNIFKENIFLNKILKNNKISETKFSFLINKNIINNLLNILNINKLNLKNFLNNLNYKYNNFYLNGTIDFIFFYNNKYYLIDYKLSWLGNNFYYYKYNNLLLIINKYYYTLQYIIYILAINKYLKIYNKFYNYENNFGGIIYLFIRGLNFKINNQSGIFFNKPHYKLINKLNKLF